MLALSWFVLNSTVLSPSLFFFHYISSCVFVCFSLIRTSAYFFVSLSLCSGFNPCFSSFTHSPCVSFFLSYHFSFWLYLFFLFLSYIIFLFPSLSFLDVSFFRSYEVQYCTCDSNMSFRYPRFYICVMISISILYEAKF